MRRVADHIDVRGAKIDRVLFPRARPGERTQFVAIVMIIRESAELEKIPKPVMRELQLCAASQVAGEKREHILRPGLKAAQQLLHARQHPAFPQRQLEREQLDIAIEKSRYVFVAQLDLLLPQNLVHDPGIRPARHFNPLQVVANAESLREHIPERLEAGPAGIDQGAVDIEK